LLVVSSRRPHGRTISSRAASDWTRHHYCGTRGLRPRPPPARYIAFLDLLLLDPEDYQLRGLHKALTRCAAFQQVMAGGVRGNRYGYPDELCDQPECFYCRLRWKKREARKFTPAKSDVARCMDELHSSGVAGRFAWPAPALPRSSRPCRTRNPALALHQTGQNLGRAVFMAGCTTVAICPSGHIPILSEKLIDQLDSPFQHLKRNVWPKSSERDRGFESPLAPREDARIFASLSRTPSLRRAACCRQGRQHHMTEAAAAPAYQGELVCV
jgi:hypothetical protein